MLVGVSMSVALSWSDVSAQSVPGELQLGFDPLSSKVRAISDEVQRLPASVDLLEIGAPKTFKSVSLVEADKPGALRGVSAVQLYRRVSPAVVLVVTESGLGSGSLINAAGDVLTNWHVVAGAKSVGVIFKPISEGARPSTADVRRARVIRVDEVTDLALIRVTAVPPAVTPINLANLSDAEVGADVHAIGHPTGEAWTYTKGVISQIRQNYSWSSESKKAHRATVIQTQTPINPGNSGGPLFLDDGRLVGVNSFKAQGEALNFAVSVADVKEFLSASSDRLAAAASSKTQTQGKCEASKIYSGANEKETATVVGWDLNCDGKVDLEVRTPKDVKLPISWVFDRNNDSRPDLVVFDFKHKSYFEMSFHDVDYDGKWDLIGWHKDGAMEAERFEPYRETDIRR
jgi:S1-C subfamily serine protease